MSPSLPTTALSVANVSLCYRLAKQRVPSFKEYAIHWLKGALTYQSFWALRDVSFSVRRGEAVGIVGLNGAGKSSLLKIIAGVLDPTSGDVEVGERVSPILELGTGFDPELTGRENIYLNGLLLGRSRREIRERERAIVDFSELGDFIDSPIRSYSSGMVGRLGFSIATAWPPGILILDEVFAAGDAAFTRKCEQRIAAFRAAGVTMLMVSHAADQILASCGRCLWLDHGRLVSDGAPAEVLAAYHARTLLPGSAAVTV